MKTTDIIEAINKDFTAKYKSASKFPNSGELWDFCIETIKDPVCMSCIVFANDHDIPPVKSMLTFYSRKKNPNEDFKFTSQESQHMGALMGFVFKFVLGYTEQKERCKVGKFDVRTATRFLNGPVVEFSI